MLLGRIGEASKLNFAQNSKTLNRYLRTQMNVGGVKIYMLTIFIKCQHFLLDGSFSETTPKTHFLQQFVLFHCGFTLCVRKKYNKIKHFLCGIYISTYF